MIRKIMTMLCVFGLLALAGCKAVTTNVLVGDAPLGLESNDNEFDMTDLTGKWQMLQKDEKPALVTVEQVSSTTLQVIFVNPDDPTDNESFKAIPRSLGGEIHYALLTDFKVNDGSDDLQGRYQLVEFTLTDSGYLVVWAPHEDNFKKFVGDSFELTETDKEVLLKGTQEQINELLKAHAEDFLFFYRHPFIMQRVPAESPAPVAP